MGFHNFRVLVLVAKMRDWIVSLLILGATGLLIWCVCTHDIGLLIASACMVLLAYLVDDEDDEY